MLTDLHSFSAAVPAQVDSGFDFFQFHPATESVRAAYETPEALYFATREERPARAFQGVCQAIAYQN
ncbi:hypothetical protein BX616_007262, partial [Lobosporangium transversale]